MKEEQFMEKDITDAIKHQSCYEKCRDLVDVHMEHGDYELAKQRLTDALKSVHELSKLTNKKKEEEKYNDLLNELVARNIDIQIVRVQFEGRGQYDSQNSRI